MGLFDLFGEIVALPIRVASAPVRLAEKVILDETPVSDETLKLARAVEKAIKDSGK